MASDKMKETKPFGTWSSPITPTMISHKKRLEDVQWDSDGNTLIWLENRSGKGVLVARPSAQAVCDLTVENSVRGGLGFGGGEFTVADGVVVFADKNGKLYRRKLLYDNPFPIFSLPGVVGSPVLSPDGKWVIFVHSDHKTDQLAIVDSLGERWPLQFIKGADFYMQPIWHPQDNLVAWIEWYHPNMPWDGAFLKLAEIEGIPPSVKKSITIAGDAKTPVSQPQFSPDGKWLSYVSGEGEWDDLILYNLENGQKNHLLKGDGFDLTLPAANQSIHTYDWSSTSEGIYYIRYEQGKASLWSVDIAKKISTLIDTSPYTWLTQIAVSPVSEQAAFIAGSPTIPDRIVRWDGSAIQIECRSSAEMVSPDILSNPQEMNWTVQDGTKVYGFYYPPSSDKYTNDALPPAIINVHGGPTQAHNLTFTPEIAYFTTRGYAWFEVNYRGSTGYGRTYQNAIQKRWGEVDIEDVLSGANMLVERKLADKNRLVIKGNSAGGFTALNCLIQSPGQFKAGICLYPVCNLFSLSLKTHKFEERYNDMLIGVLPEDSERFYQRSPAFHADHIRDALAIFQGSADAVVPQEQAEEIVDVLKKNRIPHIYRLYQGEGHGFRGKETTLDYLEQVEKFLLLHVLYAP